MDSKKLVANFLSNTSVDDTLRQSVFTTWLLVSNSIDDDFHDIALRNLKILGTNEKLLDEQWLRSLFLSASSLTKARILWSLTGLCMSRSFFSEVFFDLYSTSKDLGVLHQIGGAANDYLAYYPGAFKLPDQLNSMLRESINLDHRIIGLKLLKYTSMHWDEAYSVLADSLLASHVIEGQAALFQIHEILIKRGLLGGRASDESIQRLIASLEVFRDRVDEPDSRESAEIVISMLKGEIKGDGATSVRHAICAFPF